MDNMEAFHKVSTMQEPRCTFLTLNLMRRARGMAMEQCCPEPRAYKLAEVRDAIAECFPDVWRAWREWAGPGSDCADFDTFVPVRYAAHEAMFGLSIAMLKDRSMPPRTHWSLGELVTKLREDFPESFERWIAEDASAVRHAVERLTSALVLTFDGQKIGFGDAVTADYLRAKSAAWEWECERLNHDLEHDKRVLAMLEASGCNTLAELEAQTKQ
ncbi:conserved hypothetical protein [Paraburkholderia sacchari]|uniref:hypothetical protein n=1 Tax=Paraburkholderia sacchari TaxID=159450 RepID=UPI0039A715D7